LLEVRYFGGAIRAAPVIGQIIPGGSGGNTLLGTVRLLGINIATELAHPLPAIIFQTAISTIHALANR
jgi:hypothetical protein